MVVRGAEYLGGELTDPLFLKATHPEKRAPFGTPR